ncbi:MAG: M13 family peptidase [Pseudomonadota bacterium]|nr:M13 family peptidase [Pseudomonadota bacterium]
MSSGIDVRNIDRAVRPQDDFFLHVNGKWLQSTEIPADRAQHGSFVKLAEDTNDQLRTLVESLDGSKGGEARKIVDLYGSFMDEARLESLGMKPLAAEFARIAAMKGKDDVAAQIAHFNRIGVSAPYDSAVHQDNRDSTKYIVDIFQGGLGLPDRDYYLKDDDAKLSEARAKYRAHIEKMLGMAGERNAAAAAGEIMALETRLARVQWTKVENRDPVKTYNRVELAKLAALAPSYAWPRYLRAAGIEGKVDSLIVSQPSYFTGFSKVLEETPLAAWKQYFRWHLLKAFAPYLSKAFVDEGFAFSGTALRGIPENRLRWKRGIAVVEQSAGEALGKLYVAKHFPPERKARMDRLVANLLEAYRRSIDGLEWMGPATRKEAHAKLATFIPKIGYPAKWRDYSALRIDRQDLVGNILRARQFDYRREVAKLGKPIDRDEWFMTPQRVNAYYNPEMNEIVFPAAILQPPFFTADADDAVNYGGIGAVIGHEISHGFDDSGSQYDGVGNLRVWWTPEDKERFAQRTKALVAQYAAYSPVTGYNLNGELTLGENIADNSGLAIAFKAYQLSLGGKPAPVIDGLTGEQRFFMGWAQVWQEKTREAEELRLLKVDPHSPARFRANGAAVNQSAFHEAFGVKAGDKMYLPPGQRVSIW